MGRICDPIFLPKFTHTKNKSPDNPGPLSVVQKYLIKHVCLALRLQYRNL